MTSSLQRIERHIEALAQFTATPGQGTTRLSYSPQDKQARAYIKGVMQSAGLDVREDAIGNIYGRLAGSHFDLPTVLIGSHFDSVPHGGAFDGPAGVVMGLEIATRFKLQQLRPTYPLEVVALVEEEGASFGAGLLASRAITGQVSAEDLHQLYNSEGMSAAECMAQVGFNADNVASVIRQPQQLKAFIELHIEQGPILEHARQDIGLVETIVGLCQLVVTIDGKAGHAGTTPMDMRTDALLASSQLIQKIAQVATDLGETVATVGKLQVLPNGSNVIPSQVIFSVDVRSKDKHRLEQAINSITHAIKQLEKDKFQTHIEQKIAIHPTQLDRDIFKRLQRSCQELGYTSRTMVSGAGHDAMVLAGITPVGLVFVPSKKGLSHHPDEWTDYVQIEKGIDVIYEVVKDLTQAVKQKA